VEDEETEFDLEWGWTGRKSTGMLEDIICRFTAAMDSKNRGKKVNDSELSSMLWTGPAG
jgi:hypothetical protein